MITLGVGDISYLFTICSEWTHYIIVSIGYRFLRLVAFSIAAFEVLVCLAYCNKVEVSSNQIFLSVFF